MADFSHLERMGRELKCPICLSLLNSAISLTCNHVFCNSCIEKSMKSASSCPVCKVPYRRREVRPAPHMDNLVSIYKSMEVASGVNIFVTQTKPSEVLPDEGNQPESANCERQETGRICQKSPEKQRCKMNKPKSSSMSNQGNTNVDLEKPSFPTKKRVQVPQYPSSRDPDQRANISSGLESIVLKEKHVVNTKEETTFTPFFWLRDEESVEELSQQTDLGQSMDTPPNAPCFSDIKDSDDEIPSKISPNGEKVITSNNIDYYDSEMFDWTQRPCSPELCSSPMRTQELQVEDTDEFDGIPEKDSKLFSKSASTIGKDKSIKTRENVVPEQRAENVEVSLAALPTPRTRKTSTGDYRMKNPNKNSHKLDEKIKKTRSHKILGGDVEIQVDSEKEAKSAIVKECSTNFNSLDSNRPTHKRAKKVMFENSAVEHVLKSVSALSIEANPLVLDGMVTDLPASPDHIQSNSKYNTQKQKDSCSRLKVKSRSNSKCDREPRQPKKQKMSIDVLPKDKKSSIHDGSNEVSSKNTQPSGNILHQYKDRFQIPNQVVLSKCETVPSKIECAFCHSMEDSEASGVMVHYFNGKLVSADYNGGSKIIHAHRNCTEWAPNVYFEDDNAINLEAELARSRRIKCCCCDIKGAALGCYETSCRKSFHISCAKLIPQCRWDNENFVMLCPFHASSKLPNEIGECQVKRKKRCMAKRPSQSHQPENAFKDASYIYRHWNSCGSSGNLVLCCSALTNEEKDLVSKFKRLSGVKVLKNWDSRITHVIASTNENGACRRTLKFLMGILEGKWILSIEWIKVCMEAMEPIDEQLYEVRVDTHGIRDGPRLGRLRVLNKQPKLFDGCKFYLNGDFAPSYKGYLHDLVTAAGGTVLQRKPIPREQETGDSTSTFIIYSLEVPDKCNAEKKNVNLNRRRLEAEALASASVAIVASNSWVLDSIAAAKLQRLAEK